MCTLREARTLVTRRLMDAYVSDNGHSGWGLRTGRAVSLTNTGEALRALRALGTLESAVEGGVRNHLASCISASVAEALDVDRMRTRDLAYGVLSLHWLGESYDGDAIFAALDTLRLQDGGWVGEAGDTKAALVPTYHALLARRLTDRETDSRAIDWVKRLRRPNGLYAFEEMGGGSVAASSIVLYLLAKAGSQVPSAESLEAKVIAGVNDAFDRMSVGDPGWIELDRATDFRTYYYGHALVGINTLHRPLINIDVGRLLLRQDDGGDDAISTAFRVSSDTTTIPELLEFAIALGAIATNYDPYVYVANPNALSAETRQVEERERRLAAIEHDLALRATVVEALEKQLIQTRIEMPARIASALAHILNRWLVKWGLPLLGVTLFLLGSAAPVARIVDGTFRIADVSNWVWGVVSLAGAAFAVWALTRSRSRPTVESAAR